MSARTDSDEAYVLNLCDNILGTPSLRQFHLPFLVGDANTTLPVDAYYPRLKLVVEYREKQHSQEVRLFDHKWTRSNMTRDQQRAKYDQLRRDLLPKHGLTLIEIDYSELPHMSGSRKLLRKTEDSPVLERKLRAELCVSVQTLGGRRTPDVRTFHKLFIQQLSEYRIKRLRIQDRGTFHYRGAPLPKDHILPLDLADSNLLAPMRAEMLSYIESTGIELHKFFHHLNSSQAFALNLFYPFFERGQSGVLLRALGQRGIARDWVFERVWDKSEGTNVDVYWRLRRRGQRDVDVFCEVKLTEQKFGTAEPDADHLRKLKDIYAPRFEAAECDPQLLIPEFFFGHYQLLRNIWLAAASPDSRVLFLLPWENPLLWNFPSGRLARPC